MASRTIPLKIDSLSIVDATYLLRKMFDAIGVHPLRTLPLRIVFISDWFHSFLCFFRFLLLLLFLCHIIFEWYLLMLSLYMLLSSVLLVVLLVICHWLHSCSVSTETVSTYQKYQIYTYGEKRMHNWWNNIIWSQLNIL